MFLKKFDFCRKKRYIETLNKRTKMWKSRIRELLKNFKDELGDNIPSYYNSYIFTVCSLYGKEKMAHYYEFFSKDDYKQEIRYTSKMYTSLVNYIKRIKKYKSKTSQLAEDNKAYDFEKNPFVVFYTGNGWPTFAYVQNFNKKNDFSGTIFGVIYDNGNIVTTYDFLYDWYQLEKMTEHKNFEKLRDEYFSYLSKKGKTVKEIDDAKKYIENKWTEYYGKMINNNKNE